MRVEIPPPRPRGATRSYRRSVIWNALMEDFSHVLNWNLLYGSHDFPGPDGGTCINEAAIVASGFAYRSVHHSRDLPVCFCPIIGEVSVWLNDKIADCALRNRLLLPFVTRLAGTRGNLQDERLRLEVLRERVMKVMSAKDQRRRFTLGHQEHLLLGDMVGPWTVRRFEFGLRNCTGHLAILTSLSLPSPSPASGLAPPRPPRPRLPVRRATLNGLVGRVVLLSSLRWPA